MNAVWNSYGQLCGYPEIFKKVANFLVVGLTYGCLRSCTLICGSPAASAPFSKRRLIKNLDTVNSLSEGL